MEQLNEILAKNLTTLRKQYNYTQSDIASKIQYSDKTVSKWETGEIIPSVENLIKLSEIYGVTLDQLTHPLPEDTKAAIPEHRQDKQNKIIITLLAILAVWVIATLIFVYAKIIANAAIWMVFIWAVPVSSIVAIVFNALWGKRSYGFICISILVWSLITAFYLQFLSYNIFAIYFIGIPLQISIFLWSGLKKNSKTKNNA